MTRHNSLGKVIHKELCKRIFFTILANGICTNQNSSNRMRYIKFSEILRYKRIMQSCPDKEIINKRKENFSSWRFCDSIEPLKKSQIESNIWTLPGNKESCNCHQCALNGPKNLRKCTVSIENLRKNRDPPD